MNALVIGYATEKGTKISNFLVSRDVRVAAVDTRIDKPVENTNGLFRVLTLNPHHRDSLWLIFEIARPNVLIYCMNSSFFPPRNYETLINATLTATRHGVSKTILVINGFRDVAYASTIEEAEVQNMINMLRVLSVRYEFPYYVVDDSMNLLKEIKRLVIGEDKKP